MLRKVLSVLLVVSLIFGQIVNSVGFAQVIPSISIPYYLQQVLEGENFRPLHLRFLSYNPKENSFRLSIDKGNSEQVSQEEIAETSKILFNYFKIGLVLPNSAFWVNLRPDDTQNIIDYYLERTDIGKILLEADLQLKKDMAFLTSPNCHEGRTYWDRLYRKINELFGEETEIEIPTYIRPWIVPGEIILGQNRDGVYIYKATLKVMLEQDYLEEIQNSTVNVSGDCRQKVLNEYASNLVREIIIPKLTRIVNSSKRYAQLRQVYYSLILAQWYKQKYLNSHTKLAALIDSKDLNGLTSLQPWSKFYYFNMYRSSFLKGEYDKEELISSPHGVVVQRYFSGGFDGRQIFNSLSLEKVNVIKIPRILFPSTEQLVELSPEEKISLLENKNNPGIKTDNEQKDGGIADVLHSEKFYAQNPPTIEEKEAWGMPLEELKGILPDDAYQQLRKKKVKYVGTIVRASGLSAEENDNIKTTKEGYPEVDDLTSYVGEDSLNVLVYKEAEEILGKIIMKEQKDKGYSHHQMPFYVKLLFLKGKPVIWVGLKDKVDIKEVITEIEKLNKLREKIYMPLYKKVKEIRSKSADSNFPDRVSKELNEFANKFLKEENDSVSAQEMKKSIEILSNNGYDEKKLLEYYLELVDKFCNGYLHRIEVGKENYKDVNLYIRSGIIHAAGEGLSLQLHIPNRDIFSKKEQQIEAIKNRARLEKDEAWITGENFLIKDKNGKTIGFWVVEPQQTSNKTITVLYRDLEREFNKDEFDKIGKPIIQKNDELFKDTEGNPLRGQALYEYLSNYHKKEANFTYEIISIPSGESKEVSPAWYGPTIIAPISGTISYEKNGKKEEIDLSDALIMPASRTTSLKLENGTEKEAKFIRIFRTNPLSIDSEKDIRDILKDIAKGKYEEVNHDDLERLQILLGQKINLKYWEEKQVIEKNAITLTTDENEMLKSKNDKYPLGSYLSKKDIEKSIGIAEEEGKPGFYWRGYETQEKLEETILQELIYNKKLLETTPVVFYIMNHGFLPVPDGLKKLTENGQVTPIHDTVFLQDFLPGSYQTTSTGIGHFQGKNLDIKHVTEGEGIQFNVRYNEEGIIQEVKAQYVSKGSWCYALPGYVDYMVNLGGLRFNDISLKLESKEARQISPYVFWEAEEKISEAITKNKLQAAPYTAGWFYGEIKLFKTTPEAPAITWIKGPDNVMGADKLLSWYKQLNEEEIGKLKKWIIKNIKVSLEQAPEVKKVSNSQTDADSIVAMINFLSSQGFDPKVAGHSLSDKAKKLLSDDFVRFIQDTSVLQNAKDIKTILQAKVSLITGDPLPELVDDEKTAEWLFTAVFDQDNLPKLLKEGTNKGINVVIFRGGRGAADLTTLLNKVDGVNIQIILAGTDDGRSWEIASQDFNATGVPDCGKSLLNLAKNEKLKKFLAARMKGESENLKKDFEEVVEYLSRLSDDNYGERANSSGELKRKVEEIKNNLIKKAEEIQGKINEINGDNISKTKLEEALQNTDEIVSSDDDRIDEITGPLSAFIGVLGNKNGKEQLENMLKEVQYFNAKYQLYRALLNLAPENKEEIEPLKEISNYFETFKEKYSSLSNRFTFNDIPMRSVILVGAAWKITIDNEKINDNEQRIEEKLKQNTNWQEAANKVAKLLELDPGNKVIFSTAERAHLMGMLADGTICFTENAINESRKDENAKFYGLWLVEEKFDIGEFEKELNDKDKDIKLEKIEEYNDDPETYQAIRKIKDSSEYKLRKVAELIAKKSLTEGKRSIEASQEAKDAIEKADVIIYAMTSLEANMGGSLIVAGIQDAIKNNQKAVKIYTVNPTRENDPKGTTALDMLERVGRYLTGSLAYKEENVPWQDVPVDYIVGTEKEGLDKKKEYINFDSEEIREQTEENVEPIAADLEKKEAKKKEKRDYSGFEEQFGFYDENLLVDIINTLHVINEKGYEIKNGQLTKKDRSITNDGGKIEEKDKTVIVTEAYDRLKKYLEELWQKAEGNRYFDFITLTLKRMALSKEEFKQISSLIENFNQNNKNEVGGIDFRTIPTANYIHFDISRLVVPPHLIGAGDQQMENYWHQIQEKIKSGGDIPYEELTGYIAACKRNVHCHKQLQTVYEYILTLLKLEEQAAINTTPEIREILCCLNS